MILVTPLRASFRCTVRPGGDKASAAFSQGKDAGAVAVAGPPGAGPGGDAAAGRAGWPGGLGAGGGGGAPTAPLLPAHPPCPAVCPSCCLPG